MKRFLLLANPRTGSTYFSGLLRKHVDIGLADELLNEEKDLTIDPLCFLADALSQYDDKKAVGFKVFPEQIVQRGICFDDLVRHLGIEVVIVLWRASALDQFTSRQIAYETGIWYEGPYHQTERQIGKLLYGFVHFILLIFQ